MKSELFRVVPTFAYANGPYVVPSRPRSKSQAMRLWRWHTASKLFHPTYHVRARVMSDGEFRRLFPELAR